MKPMIKNALALICWLAFLIFIVLKIKNRVIDNLKSNNAKCRPQARNEGEIPSAWTDNKQKLSVSLFALRNFSGRQGKSSAARSESDRVKKHNPQRSTLARAPAKSAGQTRTQTATL